MNTFKKISWLLVCIILIGVLSWALADIQINETNFPDEEFRRHIKSDFDTDNDGILSDAENKNATTLDIYMASNVKDLTGIEHLPYLKKLVFSGMKSLTTLDLSHNTSIEEVRMMYMTGLTNLKIGNNSTLKTLLLRDSPLTSLDVSHNPNLTELQFSEAKFDSLDLSNNAKLTDIYCVGASIASLDVSHNPCLESLVCDNTKISSLDVSHNPALHTLDCNGLQLKTLNVQNNPNLVELSCSNNQLTSLDVSHNPKLKRLGCSQNQLTTLNISDCPIISGLAQRYAPGHIEWLNNAYGSYDPYMGEEGAYVIFDENVDITICKTWKVTVTTDGNGTAAADPDSGIPGTEVNLTATPEKGYRFYDWEVITGDVSFDGDNRFTINDSDVEIKAYFEKIPEDELQKTIEDAKLSKIKDQTYTGKKLTPKVTVKYDGKKLSEGTDYEVSYKSNKSIGTATVTVTGMGEYEGSAETTFSILPEVVELSSLEAGKKKITVEWEKGKKITGYEIEYSRKKNFKDSESLTVTKAKTTKTTIKDLKKGKTYYIRIRTYKEAGGKKYYSKWSEASKVKVK